MGKVVSLIVAVLFVVAIFNSMQEQSEPRADEKPEAGLRDQPETDSSDEPGESAAALSPWSTSKQVSPVDDSTSVWLTTYSNEAISHRYRLRQEAPARLQLRCLENTTALYVAFNDHHMASSPYHDWGHVVIRIDSQQARTIKMSESTDNRLLGLFRGNQSIPVIRSMFGGEQLLVRATPFGGAPITVTFDITGLEKEIAPLRQACNW